MPRRKMPEGFSPLKQMNEGVPPVEVLSEFIAYDPNIGTLTWKKNKGRAKAGAEVGSLSRTGYRSVVFNQRRLQCHRIAFALMTGRWPALEIDHANGIRSDNRWNNLRQATRSQQGANRRTLQSSSGFKGVQITPDGLWRAAIKQNGKMVWLGRHTNKEDAVEAYRAGSQRIFGEFAEPNRR